MKKIIQVHIYNIKARNITWPNVLIYRLLPNGIKQTLTMPNHLELDKGTLKATYPRP